MANLVKQNPTYFIVLFFLLLFSKNALGQDPVFSQYYNIPILVNPAFAGNTDNYYIGSSYRLQWPNLSTPYKTFAIGVDKKFDNLGGGLGLTILSDNAANGILVSNKLGLTYSYVLKIKNDHFLKGGFNFGFVNKALDWDKLVFGDAIDPVLGGLTPGGTPLPSKENRPSELNSNYFDLGVGFLYYNPSFYTGISLDHINSPEDGFLENNQDYKGVPLRYSIQAGGVLVIEKNNKINKGSFISPNIIYVNQGGFSQINLSTYAFFDELMLGLGYRHSDSTGDALIISAGMRYELMRFTYSFDYTISELGIDQGGSHEIGVVINFDKGQRKKVNYDDCFELFR